VDWGEFGSGGFTFSTFVQLAFGTGADADRRLALIAIKKEGYL